MTVIKTFSKHVLCWVLSLTIALQPNLVEANSAVITVDPNSTATVDATINNTPLLQIEAPNTSGISHNKFTDFNVGKPGLVINNALRNTTTNIGGAILKNPNFSGTAASLILNEVTSANRSSLSGFTEIAGQKADYILANPNGITCNGCGFINTSRSTLTTGTPTFSGTALENLSVNGGDVIVNALGLNAMETDAFDIITRAATITGAINANELTIIAGRNDVKYSDRTVTKKADDGSTKPTLAIDSSVLGGMYAGRIALVANETGVGVNMQGEMAASTSDLTLTADGRIDLKTATAKTDLTVTSQTAVDVATRAYGENDLSITAPVLDATGATVAAGNDVTLSGSTITGTNAQLIAGLQSDGSNAAQGTIKVAALGGSFVYDGGMIRAGKDINIEAATISGGASSNGISSLGNTTIKGTTSAALSGNINVGGNLSLTGGALSTTSGTGDVTGTAIINGTSYSGGNALEAGGDITVTTTGDTTIQTGGGLTSNGAVTINARNITSDGIISSQTGTTLKADQTLKTKKNAKTQSAVNTNLTSTNDMTLGGMTTAANELTITAPSLTNNGTIADGTADGATINITTNLTNTGLIYASGDMKLIVPMTLLNDEGEILAGGSIQIDKDGAGAKNTKVWNYSGKIESLNGGITINTAELLNERKGQTLDPKVESSTGGTTRSGKLFFAEWAIFGYDCSDGEKCSLTISSSSSVTTKYEATYTGVASQIVSGSDMTLNATTLTNNGGFIATNGNLALSGTDLFNTGQAAYRTTVNSSSSTTHSGGRHEGGSKLPLTTTKGPSSSSETTEVVTPGETFIQAAGDITGSFTNKIDNISFKKGADPETIKEGSANVHATSADIGTPTKESINSGITIPTKGLFLETKDPTAEFIIETNPAVNTIGALYGSDYFTQRAGVNLASEVKRLGNDDWETRVVRDQIMAVTHKRFLSNTITNDSDQYKSLMDNALAQHEDLKLSYGVALTADQVAALTSDLVWNVEVTLADGRKALKPVVYFAEATRLSIDSSGALITASGDLNLTAANDITNSGTLSGGNVTLASTAGSVTNEYGKLDATDGDLTVTADQDITNRGGLITGGNITLTATNGDFVNETETWRQSETRVSNINWDHDKILAFNDTTGARARINATNGNLSITAGKGITDSGQTELAATGDITLQAGEDVNFQTLATGTRSYEKVPGRESGIRTTVQTGSNLSAGNDLSITSGARTILQGTKAEAGNDLNISSGTDTIITAAQTTTTEQRGTYSLERKWSTEVKNDLTQLKAGNDVSITSGLDTVANGVNVTAGNDIDISSLASTSITSVQDSFEQDIRGKKYTLIVNKKDTVRSTIEAGNDVNINATLGDVTLKAAEVKAGGKVTLAALNGNVNLTSNKDVDFRHETRTSTGGMWTTFSDKGRLDEKVQHTKIDAGDGLTITVGSNGAVNVDYKDFGDLDKSIDRLSKEPGLAWMAQVKDSATPAQWNAIKEAHKSWDYSSQSLSPQAAMVIAIATSIATMGTASGAATAMMGLAEGAVMTTTQTAIHAALTAGMTSLASSAAVSLVGNKGNLGATLKQLGSSSTLRSMATAMVSAGLVAGIGNAAGLNMNPTELVERIQVAALKMSVNTAVQSTIGGQKLSDALKTNLITAGVQVIGGELSEQIGDAFKDDTANPLKYIAHAALGCAGGAALGGDCASGAGGAVVGEIAGDIYRENVVEPWLEEKISEMAGAGLTPEQAAFILQPELNVLRAQGVDMARLAAALSVGVAGGDVSIGTDMGENAAKENALGILTIAAAVTLYTTIAGDGNPIDGLEEIGKGDDPLSQALESGVEKTVELSNEHFPDATQATLEFLSAVGDKVDATVEYIDEKTGNVVSSAWNDLDEVTQNRIKGGTTVASVFLPSSSVKVIQKLKVGEINADNLASSAANALKLKHQLTAEEIASGHAFQKHVVNGGEFSEYGITTKEQYQTFVENILNKGNIETRFDKDGKAYYLDVETKTVVIKGPKGEGTAFRPEFDEGWDFYINNRLPKPTRKNTNQGYDPVQNQEDGRVY